MATIITKRGNGVPTAANLVEGEKAIDLLTGRVYTLSGGAVIECGQDPHDIDFLTDADTTTTPPADGDILTFDGATNTFVPQAHASAFTGIQRPVIYSPTGAGLVNLSEPFAFLSTPAVIGGAGEIHASSEWIIYDDINLTNPVYQSGVVTGTQKTDISGITGLGGKKDHWVVVRYTTNLGLVSEYSRPVKFSTGPRFYTIYEHGVSPSPIVSGDDITFNDTGYSFTFFTTFWSGGSSADPFTYGIGNTNNFGDTNPKVYYRVASGASNGFVQPANFGEWHWKFHGPTAITHPNMPPSHVDYFDKTSPTFNPATFRYTLWPFHNLDRVYTGNSGPLPQKWSNISNATVISGSTTQPYNRGNKADEIVTLPEVVIESNYNAGIALTNDQWNWYIGSPSSNTSDKPKSTNSGQFFAYALKKIELILPD